MRLGIMSSGSGSGPILSCTRNNRLCGGSSCLLTAARSGRGSSTFLGCTRDSDFCGGSSCPSTVATSVRSLRIITIFRNSGIGSGRLSLITQNSSIGLAGGLVVMAASSSTTMNNPEGPGSSGFLELPSGSTLTEPLE